MYVAARGLFKMNPQMIIVPKSIEEGIETLLEVPRAKAQSC